MKLSSLIVVLPVITMLLSCGDTQQKVQLQECMQKLKQQNAIGQEETLILEGEFYRLIYDDRIPENYRYLQATMDHFTKTTGQFSSSIDNTLHAANNDVPKNLLKPYLELQQSYKSFKQKMLDSFPRLKLDTNINGFMKLDEKMFLQKYANARDSLDAKLQLLFLQADAILNESAFLETIVESLPSPYCDFNPVRAIVTTDKLIYGKGDQIHLKTVLANYYYTRTAYLLMNGKQIKGKDGVFEYSQKVNDKPGKHRLKFTISVLKNGRQEAYPAEVYYMVQ